MPRLFLLLLLLLAAPMREASSRTLLTGHWLPDEAGLLDPSGLPRGGENFDLRLLHAAALRAGIGVVLQPMEGSRIDAALREGRVDFALPARLAMAEMDRLRWSVPYGTRRDMLFLPERLLRDAGGETGSAAALLGRLAARGARIAVVRGQPLPEETAEALLTARVVEATSDLQALRLLGDGAVDAVIAERLIGLAALSGPLNGRGLTVVAQPVAESLLRIAYSRASVDEATVRRMDAAIEALVADGTAAALKTSETRPAVLRYAIASAPWLEILDLTGAVVFAISGVLIARREHWSIFGTFVLAALPTVAGGVMRDLLVGRRPIWILESPVPLTVVVLVVLLGYLYFRAIDAARGRLLWMVDLANAYVRLRRYAQPRVLFEVTDALGLAVLTVTGVLVAVRFGAEPLLLWGPLLAVLTASGGGILREVVRSNPEIPALRTALVAEVPLVWGLLLSLGVMRFATEDQAALLFWLVIGTVLGAFLTRMGVVALRLPAPRF